MLAFIRYSLEAIFSGGFVANAETDFVNVNFTFLVIGGAGLVSSVVALLLRRRSARNAGRVSPSLGYGLAA